MPQSKYALEDTTRTLESDQALVMDSLTTQAYSIISTMAIPSIEQILNNADIAVLQARAGSKLRLRDRKSAASQGHASATQVQSNASNINQNTNNIAGNSGSTVPLMHAC